MFLNQRRGQENVVYLLNGVLLSCLQNNIMKFSGKWLKLENIILSNGIQMTIQMQRGKYGMYFPISGC